MVLAAQVDSQGIYGMEIISYWYTVSDLFMYTINCLLYLHKNHCQTWTSKTICHIDIFDIFENAVTFLFHEQILRFF